jgi:hypothetical protein
MLLAGAAAVVSWLATGPHDEPSTFFALLAADIMILAATWISCEKTKSIIKAARQLRRIKDHPENEIAQGAGYVRAPHWIPAVLRENMPRKGRSQQLARDYALLSIALLVYWWLGTGGHTLARGIVLSLATLAILGLCASLFFLGGLHRRPIEQEP